ncbi:MAG: diguanylate cyclase [Anaerocolumna sp.]
MNIANNLIIDLYSIGILMIIYFFSLKNNEDDSLQNKLYKGILKVTILMLTVDILSRFDGRPGTIYPVINQIGNFSIFLLSPVISSLWLFYVHDQVFHDLERTKRLKYPIFLVNSINIALLVLSQFFGWYYVIDSDNIYHRGTLFWLATLMTSSFVLAAFVLTILNRDKIDKKHFFSLLFFAVPPFICIILQIIFYGLSIVLNGIVFSILIISLYLQNHNIYSDYLTGVYNRKKLELYLKQKINTSTADKSFSAIMLDLDNFKSINDNYGHDMGDRALQISAKLLGSCLRSNDFIARFGGDEFCIILNITDPVKLDEISTRIDSCIEKYNNTSDQPYELSFSMGYAVYDYPSKLNAEEFQKQIDRLMYDNKQINKEMNKLEQGIK